MMQRATNALAALLSVLMVATSVSATTCDLTCWLRQGHSDCHSVGSVAAVKGTNMSIPGDMDMSSGHGEGVTGSGTSVNPMPCHSMSSDMADHSTALSPCPHELCGQISASTPPPSGGQSQCNSLHWTTIVILSPVNLGMGLHWIKLGIP